ncbi:MAG: serine hydrolase domain-containing protein [Bacillus sp. (in: firmicutes)]
MVDCTGASVVVIHNDRIVAEEYWGRQAKGTDAREVQKDTKFHVASVRKSYIGFAVAYAIYEGYIDSIDDPIVKYLPLLNPIVNGITIRYLLTHTHGLNGIGGELRREFMPEESWAYRGIGVNLLIEIIMKTTGKTVADIVQTQVLKPLQFSETGWYGQMDEKMADVIRKPNDQYWSESTSTEGDKSNLYISTRELAKWGYLHLKKGFIDGKQALPKEIIEMATAVQSPDTSDADNPQNGYLWFVKDRQARKTEIGGRVPKGSFQILGYTGVTLLVIPSHNLIAVRAFNSFGSPDGFDYLADVRKSGDTIMACLLE